MRKGASPAINQGTRGIHWDFKPDYTILTNSFPVDVITHNGWCQCGCSHQGYQPTYRWKELNKEPSQGLLICESFNRCCHHFCMHRDYLSFQQHRSLLGITAKIIKHVMSKVRIVRESCEMNGEGVRRYWEQSWQSSLCVEVNGLVQCGYRSCRQFAMHFTSWSRRESPC